MIVKCREVFPPSCLGSGMRFWNCFPLSSEKIQLALRNTRSLTADVSNMDLGRAAHALWCIWACCPYGRTYPIVSTVTRQLLQQGCKRSQNRCSGVHCDGGDTPARAGAAVPNTGETWVQTAPESCWALLSRSGLQKCQSLSWGRVMVASLLGGVPLLLALRYPVGQLWEEMERLYTFRKDERGSDKVFAE